MNSKHETLWNLPALAAVNFDDLKDPTDDMIDAGYAMMRWREGYGNYNGTPGSGIDYGRHAIESVYAVRDQLHDEKDLFKSQASKVLTRLAAAKDWEVRYAHGKIDFPQWQLVQYRELVGEAHELAMHTIVAAGYRPPNPRELASRGFGGGR